MKILAFHSSQGKAGATMNLGFFTRTLTGGGHQVVALYRKRDEGARYLQECGARMLYCRFPLGMNTTHILESSSPSFSRSFIQNAKDPIKLIVGFVVALFLIVREKPNVCFLMDITFPQVVLAARLLRTVTICQAQAELLEGNSGIRRKLLVRIFSSCHTLIGISHRHLEPFASVEKPRARMKVIPNSIDIDPAAYSAEKVSEFLESVRIRPEARVVCFLGGDTPIKGFSALSQVIEALSRRRSDVCVVIGGELKHSPRSAGARTRTVSISGAPDWKNARFVGEGIDPVLILRASDLLLVFHTFPHFSRPIVEAFAAGTPVLAVDDHYTRDVIEDGVNGLLCNPEDTIGVVQMIEKVVQGKDEADRLAEGGRETFRRRFDPGRIREEILEVFDSIALPGETRK